MTVALTFVLTTGLFGGLAWWACRRITDHLRDNPEGVAALTNHLFMPLLGRRSEAGQDGKSPLPDAPGEIPGEPGNARQESQMFPLCDDVAGQRKPRGGAR